MSNIFRITLFLLLTSLSACVSNQSSTVAADDEDRDVGLGGTGMLAAGKTNGDQGGGLGGTGILGEITGFGSVFVNGVEIEYDSKTPFTINGKAAQPQQLQIGDVIEVLTSDANSHTQARAINLRHEVIGSVDSVDAKTFSFTIDGQNIVQAIDKPALPEVGATVAVAGFRINETTIVSTRVTVATAEQQLLRKGIELPFNKTASRWLVQTHVQNNKAVIRFDGAPQVLAVQEKTTNAKADGLGVRILQLKKSVSGQLEVEREIETSGLPRGQRVPVPVNGRGGNKLYGPVPGSIPGVRPGFGPGPGSGSGQSSGQGGGSGYGSGSNPGTGSNFSSGQPAIHRNVRGNSI